LCTDFRLSEGSVLTVRRRDNFELLESGSFFRAPLHRKLAISV